jgi:DNA-binding MarR family transcriptional regulator
MEVDNIQFATDLRGIIGRLIKKLRKQSPTGLKLSLTERSTLAQLYQHKQLLPSELAALEVITNQSMSTVLNNLFALGYIIRTVSDTDKRKINISLSPEGESTYLQFVHERDEWLAHALTQACTAEERELLKKALVPILKIIDFK